MIPDTATFVRRSVLLLAFLLTWFAAGLATLNGLGALFTKGGFTAVELLEQVALCALVVLAFWLWKYLAKNYPPRDGIIVVAIMFVCNIFALALCTLPILLYAGSLVIAPMMGQSPAELWL